MYNGRISVGHRAKLVGAVRQGIGVNGEKGNGTVTREISMFHACFIITLIYTLYYIFCMEDIVMCNRHNAALGGYL